MISDSQGRSLELYFIDGRPDGMLTAEVFNWTGHVLMTPRTRLKEALARPQSSYTGVYLLFGERNGEPLAYVGESEDLATRLRNHEANKDWWTTVALVTSAANNLHKAHAKYLESRLVEEAKRIGRMPLDNLNTPPRPGLSESGRANMEAFLGYLFMVLPALRIDMFIENTRPKIRPVVAPDLQGATELRFELTNRKHDLKATALLIDGDFIVEAGSSARSRWEGKGSEATSYAMLREELWRSKVLQMVEGSCYFTENYAFRSPSAAAAVINGRPANGTIEWRLEGTSTTYKQWEAEQLAQANLGEA